MTVDRASDFLVVTSVVVSPPLVLTMEFLVVVVKEVTLLSLREKLLLHLLALFDCNPWRLTESRFVTEALANDVFVEFANSGITST